MEEKLLTSPLGLKARPMLLPMMPRTETTIKKKALKAILIMKTVLSVRGSGAKSITHI